MNEDQTLTKDATAPAIDHDADAAASLSQLQALNAEMEIIRAEEAKIAAEQEAALQAVRDACDAFRNPK